MNRYFTHLSTGQVKMIEERGSAVSSQRAEAAQKKNRWSRVFTKKAVERYKLALYNTLVKKGKDVRRHMSA